MGASKQSRGGKLRWRGMEEGVVAAAVVVVREEGEGKERDVEEGRG